MNRVVAFIGPSLVGKTTVAKRIAYLRGEKIVSTDSLCMHHTYHNDDPNESIELFDDLREYMDANNIRIVDIGSNTIENCSMKELDYLKKVLTVNGNEPIFYLLLPSENKDISHEFLSTMAKKLYKNQPDIQKSIELSLLTSAYEYLSPRVVHTLQGYKKTLFSGRNSYSQHLEWFVSDVVLNDLIINKPVDR